MRYLSLFFLIGILFFSSCKEDEKVILLEGKISDPKLGLELENVEIKVYTKSADNGTVSYVFEHYETIASNSLGEFEISIPFKYTLAYRLDFYLDSYFEESVEIQSEEIENDAHYGDYDLYPEAYLNVHFENSFPFDENDKLNYRIVDWETSCDGCCPPGFHEFIGDDIDESISCKLVGEEEYTIEYIVFRNGNSNVSHRIINCPAFEDAFLDISF